MRISNLNHFTEHHRFCVYREFSLSALQQKMLTHIYQPMLGPLAIGLYQTLYAQLRSDQAGYAPLEQQRKLFLAMDVEPNEKGRALLLEQTSKLEAVGLMLSFRKYVPKSDDYMYEYQLQAPLGPDEFFQNSHLTLLLRDKVGKYMLFMLRDELIAEQPIELRDRSIQSESLSIPFYEIFRLNTQVIDMDLENMNQQMKQTQPIEVRDQETKEFSYVRIITRFPKDSINRIFVENLRNQPQQLAMVQFVAKKFKLSLQEICRLLDEDDIFDDEGELLLEPLQHVAQAMFRQNKSRQDQRDRVLHQIVSEVPQTEHMAPTEQPVQMEFYLDVPQKFQAIYDVHQYNMMLRNESYIEFLTTFFPKRSIPDPLLSIFNKLNANYRLSDAVINVLIHYLHIINKSWTKGFIDAIATDMIAREVFDFERAVSYVREQLQLRETNTANMATANKAKTASKKFVQQSVDKQKPKMNIASAGTAEQLLSSEELEELKKMAKQLDGYPSDK